MRKTISKTGLILLFNLCAFKVAYGLLRLRVKLSEKLAPKIRCRSKSGTCRKNLGPVKKEIYSIIAFYIIVKYEELLRSVLIPVMMIITFSYRMF